MALLTIRLKEDGLGSSTVATDVRSDPTAGVRQRLDDFRLMQISGVGLEAYGLSVQELEEQLAEIESLVSAGSLSAAWHLQHVAYGATVVPVREIVLGLCPAMEARFKRLMEVRPKGAPIPVFWEQLWETQQDPGADGAIPRLRGLPRWKFFFLATVLLEESWDRFGLEARDVVSWLHELVCSL